MNASTLKREMQALLHLAPLEAERLWRAALVMGSRPDAPAPPAAITAQLSRSQGPGPRFDGRNVVTSIAHARRKTRLEDLTTCVLAAAGGDHQARQVWPLWLRLKQDLGGRPAAERQQLAHELTHVVQQGGGRQP